MKLSLVITTAAAFALTAFATFAAEPSPAPAPSPTAEAAKPTTVEDQLRTLVGKVQQKIQSGQRDEAAFADDLKAFEALLAEHRGEKTDAVAQVALMRAALYLEVFQNYAKSAELLNQLIADFPGTQPAASAAQVVKQLEGQKAVLEIQAALKPGAAFPDFQEKDLSGQPLSLGKFKGKVVLVDFWATWCGPCVAELPNVIAAYEKYHGKGFEIVGISLDESEERLKSFIAERKMTWAQYYDGKKWENKLGQKYGVNSIPATYLLDRDGKIIAKDLRGEALEAELQKLLAQ